MNNELRSIISESKREAKKLIKRTAAIRKGFPTRPFVVKSFQQLVSDEIDGAVSQHGPMKSAHEGYAVILEEMDELWDEIKKKKSERDEEKMLEELVQIGAMIQRFALDVLKRK